MHTVLEKPQRKKALNVTVPPHLRTAVEEYARGNGVSMAVAVTHILNCFFDADFKKSKINPKSGRTL